MPFHTVQQLISTLTHICFSELGIQFVIPHFLFLCRKILILFKSLSVIGAVKAGWNHHNFSNKKYLSSIKKVSKSWMVLCFQVTISVKSQTVRRKSSSTPKLNKAVQTAPTEQCVDCTCKHRGTMSADFQSQTDSWQGFISFIVLMEKF